MNLEIDGKQYEAKANFKFERTANKKYKDENEQYSGLEKVYQDLMAYKASALVAFWDCATSHYAKNQPGTDKIEEALEHIIENASEEDVEQLFNDAFKTMDDSGFFRLQLKEFWNNLDLVEQLAKDEKEAEQGRVAREIFLKKREKLTR